MRTCIVFVALSIVFWMGAYMSNAGPSPITSQQAAISGAIIGALAATISIMYEYRKGKSE